MPDAYSFGTETHEEPRRPSRRPLKFLGPLLLLLGAAYILIFSPWAPFAHVGDRLRYALTDATEGLIPGDSTGTPDEILARWEAEFGKGDEALKRAGPTAAMLFRNNLRGLRNAVRRDEREKIKTWRAGIRKNFATGRAWRASQAKPSGGT